MVVYYAASSLDGFLATADDSVAFLDEVPQPSEDTHTPFMETVGAIAMGRASYQFLIDHLAGGGDWPYKQPCWVFTHQDMPVPEGVDVRVVQGDIANYHADMLDAAGDKRIWVLGGGDLAGQFHDAGLLEELIITVCSRTLGSGKPVFPRDAKLTLVGARELGEGFAELRYKPT